MPSQAAAFVNLYLKAAANCVSAVAERLLLQDTMQKRPLSAAGCNQHPNAITHLADAVLLQPTVAKVTGWQSVTSLS